MELPDSCKRAHHESRLGYQHKHLASKVVKLQQTIDGLQSDVQRWSEKATAQESKRVEAVQEMRAQQVSYRDVRIQLQHEYWVVLVGTG